MMKPDFWKKKKKIQIFTPQQQIPTKLAPKTTHLWEYGNGVISKNKIKIATWNVNGIRAIYNRRAL